MDTSALFDQAIEAWIDRAKARKALAELHAIGEITPPDRITGLDDPVLDAYQQAVANFEADNAEVYQWVKMANAHWRALDYELVPLLPAGIWVRHEYAGRVFGMGRSTGNVIPDGPDQLTLCLLPEGEAWDRATLPRLVWNYPEAFYSADYLDHLRNMA